jgi:hypothetical protein
MILAEWTKSGQTAAVAVDAKAVEPAPIKPAAVMQPIVPVQMPTPTAIDAHPMAVDIRKANESSAATSPAAPVRTPLPALAPDPAPAPIKTPIIPAPTLAPTAAKTPTQALVPVQTTAPVATSQVVTPRPEPYRIEPISRRAGTTSMFPAPAPKPTAMTITQRTVSPLAPDPRPEAAPVKLVTLPPAPAPKPMKALIGRRVVDETASHLCTGHQAFALLEGGAQLMDAMAKASTDRITKAKAETAWRNATSLRVELGAVYGPGARVEWGDVIAVAELVAQIDMLSQLEAGTEGNLDVADASRPFYSALNTLLSSPVCKPIKRRSKWWWVAIPVAAVGAALVLHSERRGAHR